jgi:hypothetical protein
MKFFTSTSARINKNLIIAILLLFLVFLTLPSTPRTLTISKAKINELWKKINKSFPLWIKQYVYLKRNPQLIDHTVKELGTIQLPDGKIKTFTPTDINVDCLAYHLAKKAFKDMIIETHEQLIKFKLCKLKQIVNNNPDLNSKQIFKIAYFIGSRSKAHFLYYMDKSVDQPIKRYIQHTKHDLKIEPEYDEILHAMILMSSKNTNKLLSDMTKVQMTVYLEFQEKFKKFFNRHDLELFEGANCRCYNQPPQGVDAKTIGSVAFIEKKSHYSKNHKKSCRSHSHTHSHSKNGVQYYLDGIKTSLDFITSGTKPLLDQYKKYTEQIYKTEKLFDKVSTGEPLALIRQAIKEFESKTNIPEYLKHFNSGADITRLMIKIEQGKASVKEVLDATEKIAKVLKIDQYIKDELAIAKKLNDIRESFNKMIDTKDSALFLGNLLLIIGNTASLSSVPIYKKVGTVLITVGKEINASKAIQSVINTYTKQSVENFRKDQEAMRLGYFTQFFSDFAMDDFERHHIDIDFSKFAYDYAMEKTKSYIDQYNAVKTTFTQINDNIATDLANNNIDRYTSVGNDFDVGYFYNSVSFTITDVIKEEIVQKGKEKIERLFDSVTESLSSSGDSESVETIVQKISGTNDPTYFGNRRRRRI